MFPVVLSGGQGTRLWPLSRAAYPKQLLPLLGEETMLQTTLSRLRGLEALRTPIVVCNEEHRFLVAEQLRQTEFGHSTIILEPAPRSTAPAVALAALAALEVDDNALLLVLPADHMIRDVAEFHGALAAAQRVAARGALATFGIKPTAPETGYGYIRCGTRDAECAQARSVLRFVEKPDRSTALGYLESGDFLWNSGMFLFRADRYLNELELFAPAMLAACKEAFSGAVRDLDFLRMDADAFLACPSDSIDYAVMEKTADAVVVPLDAGWSDVGSWAALQGLAAADAQGNVAIGDVLMQDTGNSYIRAESRLVATVGVHDHVVVETADAVLVAHRERVEEVKTIVEELKRRGRAESDFHQRVYRPWGWYEGVARDHRFQVKHITVKPGATLSRQMHHHRAEHWVVVKGTARAYCGDKVRVISEDQSTYIPLGTIHRLENPGKIPLEIIEVQTGSYLGEDDIVRFEDCYGRS